MRSTAEIIIIGAGAAGLMAAAVLSNAGKEVLILEARERPGGRIFSKRDSAFTKPVELGAEFVHGKAFLTKELVKLANLSIYQQPDGIFEFKNGIVKRNDLKTELAPALEALKFINEDITVNDFLDRNFASGSHCDIRKSVTRMVKGYDAADPGKMSAI